MQSNRGYSKTFKIDNYTVKKVYDLILEQVKLDKQVKMSIIMSEEYKSLMDKKTYHNSAEISVSCHEDYYRGIIVNISPNGCIRRECELKDPKFESFLKKEIDLAFSAHY